MKLEGIVIFLFGLFCVILIALTGTFYEIINGFTQSLGIYGFILGICIVLMIILGFLGFNKK